MKTRLLKLLVCCLPMFFIGATNAPVQEDYMTHEQALDLLEQNRLDAIDAKRQLFESRVEINLSEIKYTLYQNKHPYKTVK